MKAANLKSKIVSLLPIGIAVLVALWGVPYAEVAMNANSAATKEAAERLNAAYQTANPDAAALDQKAICRDLAYLSKQGLQASAIYGEQDGRIVYLVNLNMGAEREQYALQVDVQTSWDGTVSYHTVDDVGESTIVVRPWGSTHIE